MKNIIIAAFMLLFTLSAISQENVSNNDTKIYRTVDQKAEPKDGIKAFYQKFIKDFNTDVDSISTSSLRFRLNFVVEKDGSLNDIRVLSEYGSVDLQNEAIKALKLSEWKPAKQNGEIVRSSYVLPIEFRKDIKS